LWLASESSEELINTTPTQSMFFKNNFLARQNGEEVEAIASSSDLLDDFLFLKKNHDSAENQIAIRPSPIDMVDAADLKNASLTQLSETVLTLFNQKSGNFFQLLLKFPFFDECPFNF
jgi:hypothetical protein